MAIPATNTMTAVDTLPGDEVEYTIGDPRWVMRSMSDLYSNRETAVVREYSTNAYDEHIKFNVDRPIEVTLPTLMEPYFRVRDFANGMSREVLTEVYIAFGLSTKRESKLENGMLGFGSKSAVAYTTSFKVTSIHEGTKIIAIVQRKPDWSIVLKVVAEVKSDEPSGVEVEVPVHNWQEFSHKARDFFAFWKPGTVLVDGQTPEQAVGKELVPGLYYSENSLESYVVMGNVPYRITNSDALFHAKNMKPIKFVAYVENGSVEFTPNREDLKYSDLTKGTLHKVIADFQSKIKAKAQAEINNAADHAEAYSKWVDWCGILGNGVFNDLTFDGDTLENTFKIDAMRYGVTSYRSRNNSYRVHEWQVAWSTNTLFVTGVTAEITSTHKSKAKAYCELKDIQMPSYILFTSEAEIDCKWIDRSKIVPWETIKKEVPRNVKTLDGRPRRIPGSFDVITSTGRLDQQQVPDKGDVFWVSTHRANANYSTIVNALRLLNSDATVVILGQNRQPKFRRENPEVEEVFKWFATHVETDATKLLSDDAKAALDVSQRVVAWLNKLDTNKLNDPEFKRLKDIVANRDTLAKKYNDMVSLANSLGVGNTVTKHFPSNDTSLFKTYPLLEHLSAWNISPDIYIYLNAKYASRKDK